MTSASRHSYWEKRLNTENEQGRIGSYLSTGRPTFDEYKKLADAVDNERVTDVYDVIHDISSEDFVCSLDDGYDGWIMRFGTHVLIEFYSKFADKLEGDENFKGYKPPKRNFTGKGERAESGVIYVKSRAKYSKQQNEVLLEYYKSGYRGKDLVEAYNKSYPNEARKVKGSTLERRARKLKRQRKLEADYDRT